MNDGITDGRALDTLAGYLATTPEWDGADFCDLAASTIEKTGRKAYMDHEPTVSSPSTIDVVPPFGLTRAELVLDVVGDSTLARELAWLEREAELDEDGGQYAPFEDQCERILRGAVCLKAALPDAPLAHCLHTAIIWERG